MSSREGSQDPESRLEALDVYLASLEARPEVALEMLRESADPESFRYRLRLFLETANLDGAVELVNSRGFDGKWADLATVVFIRKGDLDRAEGIIEHAREDQNTSIGQRAALAFCLEVLKKAASRPLLNPSDKEELQRALGVITPDIDRVKAHGRITSELESEILQSAVNLLQLLEEGERLRELTPLLELRTPVPLPLAQAALTGWTSPSEGLSDRLRKEHPRSIPAQLLAVSIDGELLGKTREAIGEALELRKAATTPEHRKDLGRLLLNLVDADRSKAYFPEVEEVSRKLVEEDEELRSPLEATRLLQAGKLDEAVRVLDQNRREEDPHWLQAYANCLLQTGERSSALVMLRKAADLLPHPHLLRRVASLAYETGQLSDAAEYLTRLLQRSPKDVTARRGLAAIYWDSQRYEEAAKQFSILGREDNEVDAHRLNEAYCYRQLGDVEKSLEILNELVRDRDSTVQAVIHRAELLRLVGRSRDAFEFLSGFQNRFWDEPAYLLELMTAGYGAEEELAAHAAMQRLLELQETGVIEEPILEAKTLEDLREHLRGQRELKESLYEKLLGCRAPWLLVDDLLGETSYMSWSIRTQPLRWIAEDRNSRAGFAVPSTNGFTRGTAPGAPHSLVEITAALPNQPVVIDLSALVTLHRLNLISSLTSYAGKVYVPASYLVGILEERSKLLPHQPSRERSIREIKRMLDTEKVTIADPAETPPLVRVDEYVDAETEWGEPLRLLDILDAVHAHGQIDDEVHGRMRRQQLKPARLLPDDRPLAVGAHILTDLETLRRVSAGGALEALVTCFSVYVTEEERREVITEVEALDVRENVLKWQQDLWDDLRQLKEVVFAPILPVVDEDDKDPVSAARHLDALNLAKARGYPLIADDRVLQAVMLSNPEASPGAAFGTDALLLALLKEGSGSEQLVADAYMKLIRWRYRFLVVPPRLLREYASRFAQHPPGQNLRQIASYVHDCMADPGLLSGLEDETNPPISMAHRFFLAWLASVAEFLIDIWDDDRFEDEGRAEVAFWSCRELLPCPPYNLGVAGAGLSELLPQYMMGRALIRSIIYEDEGRMNRALRTLGGALGLTDAEYKSVISRIVYERSCEV